MNVHKQTVEDLSVIREEAERKPEGPRRVPDPSSPEFTHLLMKCFYEARNRAIEENAAFLAGQASLVTPQGDSKD